MGYNIPHPVEGSSCAPYPFYPWLLRPSLPRSYPVSPGQCNFFFFIGLEKRNGSRRQRERERKRERERSLSRTFNWFPRRLSKNIISA